MASAVPVSALPLSSRIRPRTALVASADRNFRQRSGLGGGGVVPARGGDRRLVASRSRPG
jgi:hypothetical protein